MRKIPIAAALSASLLAHPAFAQSASDKATAEALFSSARKLMAAGDYTSACPKLAASQKLDPGVGTLLNLADCYEKKGQTASAWGEFREASSAAHAAGSKDREQAARDRALALERRLSRVTITLATSNASVRITCDGAAVDAAALGTPLPMDPGAHLIEAKAPGKVTWSNSIDVKPGPVQLTVTIPALTDEAQASDAPKGTPVVENGPAGSSKEGGAGRGIALGVAGVGVVGVVVGTIFGLKAASSWSSAKNGCQSFPYGCDTDAQNKEHDARTAGNVSTVAFVVGGVGLAAGAILWFTAPHGAGEQKGASDRALGVRVGPSSVALIGAF
jgi:hypothetical protein